MQSLKYLSLSLALATFLCAGAFAKDSNSGSFDLDQPAKVGTTVLQPGHYTAQWTGTANSVTVSIVQKGKTIATAPATIKQLPAKAPYSAVSLRPTQDNNQRVEEIDFSNRSEALVLSGM